MRFNRKTPNQNPTENTNSKCWVFVPWKRQDPVPTYFKQSNFDGLIYTITLSVRSDY